MQLVVLKDSGKKSVTDFLTLLFPLSLSRLVFFSSVDPDLLFLFQSHFLPFMKITHPERECIYDWLGVPEREGKIYNKKSQIKHREIIMN